MLRNILRNVRHSLIISCGFLVLLAFQRMQQYDIHPRETSLSSGHHQIKYHRNNSIRSKGGPFDHNFGFMSQFDQYLSNGLSKVFSIGLFRFVSPPTFLDNHNLNHKSPRQHDEQEEGAHDQYSVSSSSPRGGAVYETLRSSFTKRTKAMKPKHDKSTIDNNRDEKNDFSVKYIVEFTNCSNPSLFDAAAVFQQSLDQYYRHERNPKEHQDPTGDDNGGPINVSYQLYAVVPSDKETSCLETLQSMGYVTISLKDIPIPNFLQKNRHPIKKACLDEEILLDIYAFHNVTVDLVVIVPLPSIMIHSPSQVNDKVDFAAIMKQGHHQSKGTVSTNSLLNQMVRIYQPNNTPSQGMLKNHLTGQSCGDNINNRLERKENKKMIPSSLIGKRQQKQQRQTLHPLCTSSTFSLCCGPVCEVRHYKKMQEDLRLHIVTFPEDCPVPWDCSSHHKGGEGKQNDLLTPYCLNVQNQWFAIWRKNIINKNTRKKQQLLMEETLESDRKGYCQQKMDIIT